MHTQKDAGVFRKPELISSLPYIAEKLNFGRAREEHDPSASLRAGFSRAIRNN
jgi:hypothetical protein